MVNFRSETARQEMLRDLLEGHGRRYRQQTRGLGLDFDRMPKDQREALRVWFEGWHAALQEAYRCAINEDDGIIGKQWLLNDTVRKTALPPR